MGLGHCLGGMATQQQKKGQQKENQDLLQKNELTAPPPHPAQPAPCGTWFKEARHDRGW
jgi:hypothetical protein